MKFSDADLNDHAKGLVLNITSDINNNQISASVLDSRYAYKMIPGETHKASLDPFGTGKEYGREYYLELKPNKNIHNLTFELTYHNTNSSSSLSYSLGLTKDSLHDQKQEDIPLKPEVDQTDMKIVRISKQLEAKPGHYVLKLKNNHPDTPARVAFRFVVNGVKEVEENGVIGGLLQPGQSNDMQLMITRPGHLNLTLMSCNKKLAVYKAKSTFLKTKLKESEEIMGIGMNGSMGPAQSPSSYYSFDDYISTSGPLYIRVENQDQEPANFTLISRIDYMSSGALVGGLFNLLPVQKFYESGEKNKIIVEAYGPALSKAAMDIIYPNVTELRITMSIIISASTKDTLERNEKILRDYKYCSENFKAHGIYQTDIHFTVTTDKFLESQKLRNITVELDDDITKALGDSSSLVTMIQSRASILVKAKVDLYEDIDFDPVATFIEYSEPTNMPTGYIYKATSQREEVLGSTASKILLLFMMVLFMVVVLFLFYIGANKLSGGYTPMSSSEVVPSTSGKALEMVDASVSIDRPAELDNKTEDASV